MTLARQQQTVLKRLIVRLYDQSLEGLDSTKWEIEDLRDRHAWYHSSVYQIIELKSKITSIQTDYDERITKILSEIHEQKKRSKEILLNVFSELGTTMDTRIVGQFLNELMNELDKLVTKASLVLLGSIFVGTNALFSFIAPMIASLSGSAVFGFVTLGLGTAVSVTSNEVLFRRKLSQLNKSLADNIEKLHAQKVMRIRRLDGYFDRFVRRLQHPNSDDLTVEIAWFDENILSKENQNLLQILLHEFSADMHQIVEFDDKDEVIEFVQSNIDSDIILVACGSAGEAVISEVGYYYNIKGIVLYCMQVARHQRWTGKYKKMLSVTSDSDEVIEKIKQIKCGDVYFMNDGFSLDDVKQKNTSFYFSTHRDGFIVQSFKDINVERSYHRNTVEQLHNQIVSRKIYPNGIPQHFQLGNLYQFVDQFLEALRQTNPEKSLIALYTREEPYYYSIVNSILNRFDEPLISLAGDYIKALRYALIMYVDKTNRIPNTHNVKFYRGLCLKAGNSFEEFQRKFKVHDYIIFPSFSSTSMNKEAAKSFTGGRGVLLEIVADCTLVNKPKHISADSCHAYEDEVLLNCFRILKVMGIRKVTDNLLCYECNLTDHFDN